MDPTDSAVRMRSVLMTPGVFDSMGHIKKTRALLLERIAKLLGDNSFRLSTLDEFILSPTFYFVYQVLDRSLRNDDILLCLICFVF